MEEYRDQMCNWGWFGAGQGRVREARQSAASVTQGRRRRAGSRGEEEDTAQGNLGLELDGVTETGLVALRLGPPKCRL